MSDAAEDITQETGASEEDDQEEDLDIAPKDSAAINGEDSEEDVASKKRPSRTAESEDSEEDVASKKRPSRTAESEDSAMPPEKRLKVTGRAEDEDDDREPTAGSDTVSCDLPKLKASCGKGVSSGEEETELKEKETSDSPNQRSEAESVSSEKESSVIKPSSPVVESKESSIIKPSSPVVDSEESKESSVSKLSLGEADDAADDSESSGKSDKKSSESDWKSLDDGVKENGLVNGICKDEDSVKSEVNGVSRDDDSVRSDGDSEKENVNVDLPMDLSTKSSSSGNPPDVIMLSDDDSEDEKMMNGIFKEPSPEELKLHNKMIKQLQAELRNEEAKLVLLRKLRQSQVTHQLQEQNNIPNNKQPSSRQQQPSAPPPLVRGGQQQMVPSKPAHSQPPQLMRGNQMGPVRGQMQGPPPLVMAQQMDQRHMMQGMRSGMMPGAQQMMGFRPVQAQNQNHQVVQQQPVIDTQTPAQRQAAAKCALRKQLEKTLLQIPPPKPPPPEMNFIPGLASPDFIYLLGLEEVVNFIIDADLISKGEKSPDERMVCNPFTCIQCGTDFTPVWKREKPGSKNVICEQCVTTNQKKALKQEHTNRLKSAFVKALQQEQEIERMQAQIVTSPVVTTTINHSSLSTHVTSAPMNMTPSHMAYKPAAETLRHHPNLLQAHQASLRMGQPLGLQAFNPRAGFPYQMPFGAKPSDLQRQYLLDLIPNRGVMPWK